MIKDIKDCFCSFDVYNIYSACMYEPTFNKFKAKAQSFSDSSFSLFGYYCNDILMGVIVTREKETSIEIVGIAVKEKARRKGVGTKLVDYIRENSDKPIFASTDSDAVDFYKKYGFNTKEHTVSKSDEIYTRFDCFLNFLDDSFL